MRPVLLVHTLLAMLMAAPLPAIAADYNNSPLLVVGGASSNASATAGNGADTASPPVPSSPPASAGQPAPASTTAAVVAAPTQPAPPPAQPADPTAAITAAFPTWAVTVVGQNSSGGNPVVPAPSNPAAAPVSTAPVTPGAATAPAAPAAPPSPIGKLWPIDTVPIFMRSCMGLHVELLGPCKCIITNLMVQMPHDEFLKLTADGTIEQDARLSTIRYQCLGTAPAGQR